MPIQREIVVHSRGIIIAPKQSSFKAVDAILPPRHLIKVTVNRGGHVIDGPGLLAASKVILQAVHDSLCRCEQSRSSRLGWLDL